MNYAERIVTIAASLDRAGIPYSIHSIYEGWQLRFPWCAGDIAVHDGTYGAKTDKVESYQFPWDEGDVSVLMVGEAIEKIITYYLKYVINGEEM
jgi:hypothetical protein